MAGKLLITGLANTGKTSLLKTLKDCLVFARDGKPFSLPLPHANIPEFDNVDELLDFVQEKLEAYNEKMGKYPKTVVFDSVSRIFMDMENNCSRKYKGFDVWSNLSKEVTALCEAINQLNVNGFNTIMISHCTWDERAGRYTETCKGSFAKEGGFLSVCDYAINIDRIGSKFIVSHRGNLSRTLLDDMPDKQEVKDFNLQDYISRISEKSEQVSQEWSI
jgi:predicted ATP-dependent endonuclease of OLD family